MSLLCHSGDPECECNRDDDWQSLGYGGDGKADADVEHLEDWLSLEITKYCIKLKQVFMAPQYVNLHST